MSGNYTYSIINRIGWTLTIGFVVLFVIMILVVIFADIEIESEPQQTAARTPAPIERPAVPEPEPEPDERFAEAERRVGELLASGFITDIRIEIGRVYVNPFLWNATNVQQKETFGRIMELYHMSAFDGRSGRAWIEIYDGNSGKRIARSRGGSLRVF